MDSRSELRQSISPYLPQIIGIGSHWNGIQDFFKCLPVLDTLQFIQKRLSLIAESEFQGHLDTFAQALT